MRSIHVSSTPAKFRQDITIDPFHLIADEPPELGGDDGGPAPFEFVLAGLGACKAMTVKMYADRKGWALHHVAVDLVLEKNDDPPQVIAQLRLEGELTPEQRQRLLEIADKCPVHRFLATGATIQTFLV